MCPSKLSHPLHYKLVRALPFYPTPTATRSIGFQLDPSSLIYFHGTSSSSIFSIHSTHCILFHYFIVFLTILICSGNCCQK